MTPKIILLDGSAFLFRAYFSTQAQGLSNADGFPTGVIFGVVNSLKQLKNKYPESDIIAIFDHKGKNFRHTMYEPYKANRKPAEQDLIVQIEPLYEVIQAMGLPFLCVPKVEADDVIATLAIQAQKENIPILIASGDKDLYQLVDDNTHQLDMKGKLMDAQAVLDKVGVRPNQILDFLSLTGDSSDNIPGVPSVGPKTAVKWLQTYGGISGVKDNAHKIKGKVGEKLRDSFELLDLSYRLASLKVDVVLNVDFEQCQAKPDTQKLQDLYQKYGFKQWLRQLETKTDDKVWAGQSKATQLAEAVEAKAPANDILSKYTQKTLLDWQGFLDLVALIKTQKQFVFDTETTGLDYMNAQIVGLVFLLDTSAYYIPLAHTYMGAPTQLDRAEVLAVLKPVFEDNTIGKIGQNLKYDAHILVNHDIKLTGIMGDTMLMSYCLNSTATRHNMDDLARFYLGHTTIKFSEVAGKGKNQLCFDQISLEQAAPYACEDVIITHELSKVLTQKLSKHPSLLDLYNTIELPLVSVMVDIERNGVLLDVNVLYAQQKDILVKLKQQQQSAYDLAGNNFNLDSPKQVRSILFDVEYLNLEPKKTTPSGEASTNESALKSLDHPLAELLLEYRGLAKLNSTYLEALPKQVDRNTGRVHTSYHQSGTATGRLSSSNPNLQNIPIRSKQGAQIRSAFVARQGFSILAADYSQIELRIMAHLAQDKGLINAFNQGLDVHKSTAAQMFDKPLEVVSAQDRRNAKAINFGLMYGMGAFSLAKQIGISRTLAKTYITQYFSQYPDVENYVKNTQNQAKEQGFVQTLMGRRLYLPDINSKNKTKQQHAMRLAINAPMQGGSADIIKKAMFDIQQWIEQNQHPIKLIMQVHDELVFEVADEFIAQAETKINQLMTHVIELGVPMVVDIGVGNNWQEAH